MVDKMEGLLAQSVIDAFTPKSSDLSMERMTNLAMRENLSAQQNLGRFQEERVRHLKRDMQNLQADIQTKNTEKRDLQQKLKTALGMYEEANSNTKAWMDLLNQPFHQIAKSHEGFNHSYNEHMKDFAEIILDSFAAHEVLDDFAEKLEISDIEVQSLKNKEALKILNNTHENPDLHANNNQIINKFKKDLVNEYSKNAIEIAKEIKKTGKSFK